MRILGITDGQTSGAAIVENGKILAANNEERIVRIKQARGFPRESIREVLALSGTQPKDVHAVAIAQENMEFRNEISDWPGWFEARSQDGDMHGLFFSAASRYGHLARRIPVLAKAYYGLRTPLYKQRKSKIPQILKQEYGINAPVHFFHHHYAHAAAAYFTSNFEDALVVTMDGGGDGDSSHIYSVKSGNFKLLSTTTSYDSLGNYYAYVTSLCGFKAKRHEGKITGLAARGRPLYAELLRQMIACEDGRLVNRGQVLFSQALDRLRQLLPSGWSMEDLSSSIQLVSESIAKDYIGYWLRKTGHRNVALAGGLFANVRINEEIHMLPMVESTFVHPGMSDEGLAVGAALALWGESTAEDASHRGQRLDSIYLGRGYTDKQIHESLQKAGLEAVHYESGIEERVAELLAEGKVIARFSGAMEYGPRALGNRSILYQPGDPSVNDWLNELLRRTEFMPFAPSSLAERTADLYENTQGALETARFMTMTFHCTPLMIDRCAGVVHVDNTARPQIVNRKDNPSYHRIIERYAQITGIPVIINTSYNIHEEPIVRSPDDAIRAFLDSRLDYLAMGNFLVAGPIGSEATRKKWEGKSKWGRPQPSSTCR